MSPGAPDLLFLVDAAAGGGRVRSRLDAALREWDRARSRIRIVELRVRPSRVEGLREADAVVAVGGDGTVTAVAAALLEAAVDVPLGVVPLGTGNAFAHSLGIGTVSAALRAIAAGASHRIDVMLTDHPGAPVALVSISGGFEGRYMERYTRLRRLGRIVGTVYAIPAIASRSRGIGLVADGRLLADPAGPVFNVGLYNMRAYAGGLVPWPQADPTDGQGDAAVVEGRCEYLRTLRTGAATGVPIRWSRAELESTTPIQMDGNVYPAGRVSVRIAPGALSVLAPPLPA